jgi:hypothetical protein
MRTGWVITSDFLAEGTDRGDAGVFGPATTPMSRDEIITHPDAKEFRIHDDDGELYYIGFNVGDDLFAPLDDFGHPNAGATEIRYRDSKTRKWTRV